MTSIIRPPALQAMRGQQPEPRAGISRIYTQLCVMNAFLYAGARCPMCLKLCVFVRVGVIASVACNFDPVAQSNTILK